jgi:DNA-binding response OmpR family regulator
MNERRRRVLVVEDEVKVGVLVCRILAREHDPVLMTRAQDALGRIAQGERFDLILCGLMLSDMTGMDLHERLGTLGLADRMAFMTAGAFTARAAAFLEQSGVPWIGKPFEIAELLTFVREQFQRSAPVG